ncbi:hypothetical protein RD1_3701 [Roseobacter denitrificans OCh 114]|uniref:Uncharacterized protein n=1 Tax=Roseobacter denitrificans (strain ATCC 33942 / OCh 114) TaxID=375451 RepID=Q162C0_ROSDO|nr:hypothetical protein RD1_3701 [Roseobacter denitrificans OCh 114]
MPLCERGLSTSFLAFRPPFRFRNGNTRYCRTCAQTREHTALSRRLTKPFHLHYSRFRRRGRSEVKRAGRNVMSRAKGAMERCKHSFGIAHGPFHRNTVANKTANTFGRMSSAQRTVSQLHKRNRHA